MTLNNLDDKIKILNEKLAEKEMEENQKVEKAVDKKRILEKKLEDELLNLISQNNDEIQTFEHNYNKEIGKEAAILEEINIKFEESEKQSMSEIKNLER